jgi:hypothetical protein
MKELITLNSVLNEIRLLASHPHNSNKIFILLEGDTDIRLFRSLLNSNYCYFKSIPGGISQLEKGLLIISSEFQRVIGIRDADFMHLQNKTPKIAVLFLTDSHDIETMMVGSDEAFHAVVSEFYSFTFNTISLRDQFFNSIKFLGYTRWLNDINNLKLNFKGIGIANFIDIESFKINEKKCVEEIINRSPNAIVKDIDSLLTSINLLMESNNKLDQVCCGHDVIQIMAIFFNEHNKKGVQTEQVQSSFRISYNLSQFQKTILFTQLKKWADQNKFQII